MNKLKILKNIEIDCDNPNCNDRYNIRRAVIEWLKELESNSNELSFSINGKDKDFFCETINWIEYFFSISDDEMKEVI